MILAVLSGDDYEDAISALTENGFFVTVLNSSGGFFRRKNATVMIGTDCSKCDQVLEILRESARPPGADHLPKPVRPGL